MQLLTLPNHAQLLSLLSGAGDTTDGISETEIRHLCWLGAHLPEAGNVVEIGSHRGKSICCIASGIRHAGKTARVHAVDLWTSGQGKTFDHYASAETWRIFNEQLAACGVADLVRPVMMSSRAAAAKRRRPIHLLFIDAGHKYKDVVQDCRLWSPFIPSGGRIAFHDFGTRFPGVDRVVNEEILATGNWTDVQVHHRIWSATRK